MKIEMKIYLLVLSIVISIVLFLYQGIVQKDYNKEMQNFKAFSKSADRLVVAKKQNENNLKVLLGIKERFPLVSHQERGDIHKIVFKSMNQNSYLRLMNMLINSNLFIEWLEIKRLKDGVVIRLEVKI